MPPTITHIRTFLPLPSGEVAMPQGIDGEGGAMLIVPYVNNTAK